MTEQIDLSKMEPGQAILDYNGQDIRTIKKQNMIWWCIKDVCDVLDIKEYKDTISSLAEDQKERFLVADIEGRKLEQMSFANDCGLFNIIFQTHIAEVIDFRTWIMTDIIHETESSILLPIQLFIDLEHRYMKDRQEADNHLTEKCFMYEKRIDNSRITIKDNQLEYQKQLQKLKDQIVERDMKILKLQHKIDMIKNQL